LKIKTSITLDFVGSLSFQKLQELDEALKAALSIS